MGDNMDKNYRDSLAKIDNMNMRELKEFMKRYDIDATDCRVKEDYIHAIASSRKFTDFTSVTIKAISQGKTLHIKDLSNEMRKFNMPVEDKLIAKARNLYTNFKEADHLLAYLKMQFHNDDYESVIKSADRILECAERSLAEFETSVFSYSILSAQHILEGWIKVGVNVNEAANSLIQAKRAFKADSKKKRKVMHELIQQIEKVYVVQTKNARKRIASTELLLNEVKSIGAPAKFAEGMLYKAKEALHNKNYPEFFAYLNKAENDAKASKDKRIQEIKDSIPDVKTIIDEAKEIGANVGEAKKLYDQADLALKDGDYVLCVELARRCEEKAMKAQQEQIQRALELRKRQVQKTSELMSNLQNIVSKTKPLGIDTSEAKAFLNETNIALQQRDYIKIMKYGREAEKIAEGLKSKIEGFAKIPKKPTRGVCRECKSKKLKFFDNGWGKCLECGWMFQWFIPKKN